LNEILLRPTESTFVGDIVDMVVGFSVLTVGTSDLDVETISDLLEFSLAVTKVGQVNVDRSAKGSAAICGAGGDVTKILGVSEFGNLLDLSGGTGKSAENFTDVGTLLHRDDTELIFLVNPCQESLGIVVENTSTFRPVTVKATSLKETVTFLEQEVIINQLLLLLGGHGAERVISSLKVTGKSREGGGYKSLNLVTLLT
jgi:hypothetical protein